MEREGDVDRDVAGDEGGEGKQNCSQMSCSLRFSLAIDRRNELLLLFGIESLLPLRGEYGECGGEGKGDNCGVFSKEETGVPSSSFFSTRT